MLVGTDLIPTTLVMGRVRIADIRAMLEGKESRTRF
jgi:hypothetical protein